MGARHAFEEGHPGGCVEGGDFGVGYAGGWAKAIEWTVADAEEIRARVSLQ